MLELVKNFNYTSSTENDKVNLMLELLNLNDDDLNENLEYIINNISFLDNINDYILIFKNSDRIYSNISTIIDLNIVYDTIFKLKDYKKAKNIGKVKKVKKLKKSII